MFWASSGSPGVILDASWAASVASWRPLGALLGYLEAMLGRLGTILDVMEPSWRPSWAPSRSLGPSWEPLGPFGAVSGLSGRPLGRSSGHIGGLLGPSEGRKGAYANIVETQMEHQCFWLLRALLESPLGRRVATLGRLWPILDRLGGIVSHLGLSWGHL